MEFLLLFGTPWRLDGSEFVLAIPGSVPLSADSHLRLASSGDEMTIEGHLHAIGVADPRGGRFS